MDMYSITCYFTVHCCICYVQGVGEGGQGLVLYIFCLPQIYEWSKGKLRKYTCTPKCYESRKVTDVASKTPTLDHTNVSSASRSTGIYYDTQFHTESAAHRPIVRFTTTETNPYRTRYSIRTTGTRTHSSIAVSGIPTDTSLLSDIDFGQNSSETNRNALLSVVYMYMKFDALKVKTLHKFLALNLNDFQQFLLSLTVNCGTEKHIHFFDTAEIESYETFPDLFDYLNYFWDYINYNLLECVITMFGDDELKKDLNIYRTQLAEVQGVTTLQQLSLLMQSHPDLQIVRPHGIFVELSVRLEANWDSYTMMDVKGLRQTFISTYSLTPYSIAFSSAQEGTIVLKLWLRSECAPMIFHCKSQPIIDSRHSRILQITVDGIPYQFAQSQVVNVEVCIHPEFSYCGVLHACTLHSISVSLQVHVTATTHPGNIIPIFFPLHVHDLVVIFHPGP